MGRLSRKGTYKTSISKIMNVFDAGIMTDFRITELEYANMCRKCSDFESDIISKMPIFMSFSEKRELIKILNKYIRDDT